jgi:hypothetical protein
MATRSLDCASSTTSPRRRPRTVPRQARASTPAPPPRIFALHPLLIGLVLAREARFAETSTLGFDTVLLPAAFAPDSAGDLFRTAD